LYNTSSPVNSKAEVRGVELNYVQDLSNGFGFNVNYTYTDAEETGKVAGSVCGRTVEPDCTMIGASKRAYNVGAFFEGAKFAARVGYSYRSGFLNGFSRNTAQYQAEIGTLSATLSYKLSENLSLSLDGKDLNNPMHRSEIRNVGAANLPGSFYKNGRQIFLSLNGKM
jgi:iron complex outermembrane receptor protein